jgi:SAM-dependent methyltransferase
MAAVQLAEQERAAERRPDENAQLAEIAAFFDEYAPTEDRWLRRNRTYQRLVQSLVRFIVPRGASVLEIGSGHGDLLAALGPRRGVGVDVSPRMVEEAAQRHPELEFVCDAGETFIRDEHFDYVVFSDVVPFAEDLLLMFRNAARMMHPRSRVIVHSYSGLWKPIIALAELLRLKARKPLRNWVSPEDVRNLLDLAGFDVVKTDRRILFPMKVPLLSTFLNGIVGSIWPFTWFSLTYWVIARPRPVARTDDVGVSVIVPCRNEAGTIAEIVERVPEMGTGTEIVFVEGGSTDDTRGEIERQIAVHPGRRLSLYVQQGRGKADAVRVGFEQAGGAVVMILDADLTVSPEDLPKFHDALINGGAELVNGSRLVYGLEPGAMRFLNVLGNKLFALIFGFLIGQFVKDTLCGTKALLRSDYELIAANRATFGDFDPFGDFDLLLGAAKLGLKISDLPVRYGSRRYGETNISRFQHGLLLLRMTGVAFRKFKVDPVRLSRESRHPRASTPHR